MKVRTKSMIRKRCDDKNHDNDTEQKDAKTMSRMMRRKVTGRMMVMDDMMKLIMRMMMKSVLYLHRR
jgi:hypothetical protein